jgi:hypothetical protein
VTHQTFAILPRFPLLALGSLLLACGGQRMSLGSNDDNGSPDASKPCNGGTHSGSVFTSSQADIDALLGCEKLEGSLGISQLNDTGELLELSPLASLRLVTGEVELEGFSSLAGLEALEQVGSLSLRQVGGVDLAALSHLERVIWDPPGRAQGGGLNIANCPQLQSLAGLEQLTTWSWLFLSDDPELETLTGLASPGAPDGIYLMNLPALHDLHGLESVDTTDYMSIYSTGVASLQGLKLRGTQSLEISGNPNLTDLNALTFLTQADQLEIVDNDSLTSVALRVLAQVDSIKIEGNDALKTIYAYGGDEGAVLSVRAFGESDPESVPLSRQLFEVGNNARLSEITGPDGFSQVQQVSIWGNPALTRLNLNHLKRADGLEILDNAALRTLVVPQLERVGDLAVVNNPQLSTASLDDVLTFTRTLSGNGDPVTPAAPLPSP